MKVAIRCPLRRGNNMIVFDHAVRAGYDPNAGHTLWNHLIAEIRASDNPDVRRSETGARIFRTHQARRIANAIARRSDHSWMIGCAPICVAATTAKPTSFSIHLAAHGERRWRG
jgi:hypothetical protein